jgi:hypothetical protein
MFVASFYYLVHNGHIKLHKSASLGLFHLILKHNFDAFSSGLGGGGLGLKTAWAEFPLILAPLYLILPRFS